MILGGVGTILVAIGGWNFATLLRLDKSVAILMERSTWTEARRGEERNTEARKVRAEDKEKRNE